MELIDADKTYEPGAEVSSDLGDRKNPVYLKAGFEVGRSRFVQEGDSRLPPSATEGIQVSIPMSDLYSIRQLTVLPKARLTWCFCLQARNSGRLSNRIFGPEGSRWRLEASGLFIPLP